jgi:hypothetical protein
MSSKAATRRGRVQPFACQHCAARSPTSDRPDGLPHRWQTCEACGRLTQLGAVEQAPAVGVAPDGEGEPEAFWIRSWEQPGPSVQVRVRDETLIAGVWVRTR